ncbi:hypothetical protein [Tissierella sp.]|uniref:hypothetical protein n=1 Tax=Tissierella sp. TaxID=41274 RepID=UPI00306220AB
MKTWEMIKELTENPKKKFKNKNIPYIVVACNSINLLVNEEGNYINVPFDAEWEEVKEPVSFIQVLERVKNNLSTRITLHDEARERIYAIRSLSGILRDLDEEFDSKEISKILLEGKWYIE